MTYAEDIEGRQHELVEMAYRETGLPKSPRLAEVELPRHHTATAASRRGRARADVASGHARYEGRDSFLLYGDRSRLRLRSE